MSATRTKQVLTKAALDFGLDALPPKLARATMAKLKADGRYDKAWRAFWHQIPALPRADFWSLAAFLYRLVEKRLQAPSAYVAVERAVDEFFRLTATQESMEKDGGYDGTHPVYEYWGALMFITTWNEVEDEMSVALEDVDLGRGDDGRGDLFDALPLAGLPVYEAVVLGKVDSEAKLTRVIAANVGGKATAMGRLILEGENYFDMRLREEAEERLLGVVRNTLPEVEQEKLED